uniref:Uncharacterized protein n=1 Tax=Psilocybe cubensis TaxID=181762 RepID=A0A8H7XVK4_PSICU
MACSDILFAQIQPRISGEPGHFSGTLNRSQYEKTWGFGGGTGQHTEGFGASSKSNVTADPIANPEDRVGQHEDLKHAVAKPDLEECAFESFDASVRSKAQ